VPRAAQAEDRVRLFASLNDFDASSRLPSTSPACNSPRDEATRKAPGAVGELAKRLGAGLGDVLGGGDGDGEGLSPERFVAALAERDDWRELCDGLFGELAGLLGQVPAPRRDAAIEAIRAFVTAPASSSTGASRFPVAAAVRHVPEAVVRAPTARGCPADRLLGAVEYLLVEESAVPEIVLTVAARPDRGASGGRRTRSRSGSPACRRCSTR